MRSANLPKSSLPVTCFVWFIHSDIHLSITSRSALSPSSAAALPVDINITPFGKRADAIAQDAPLETLCARYEACKAPNK